MNRWTRRYNYNYKVTLRHRILWWWDEHDGHLRWPRAYNFFAWVVMPKSSGWHLGFRSWLRWMRR